MKITDIKIDLGHSSITSTEKYIIPQEEDLRKIPRPMVGFYQN